MNNFYFFYGGPLSNWSRRYHFTVDGIEFNCGEQWMMYTKALLFEDLETAEQILKTKRPKDQKSLGRKVRNWVKSVWDEQCIPRVVRGLTARFQQNPELAKILLDTGDTELVEASPTDIVWGVGLSEDDPRIQDRRNWRGENRLGQALMIVRDNLRQSR